MSAPIRVLVVDDHKIVRKGICALLASKRDIQVVGEGDTGAAAASQAEILKPDIVLMDLVMPTMDGIQATREITSRQPETRILILTSFAEKGKVLEAIKAGALGYLLKDSGPEELLQAIHQVHRGEPSLDSYVARLLLSEISAPPKKPLTSDPLTPREVDILREIAQGLTNKEISVRLSISEQTVHTHVGRILTKLHLASRTQAALYAFKEGIARLEDVPRSG